ncbi:MAG: PAS domain S-box protein [Nitrospira sp.]|nr:PAS domain S-box protein [Nitrospira sp.]MDH4242608.1 PAS domain S-box protein [Nitrospira sp.]MDH4355481.1 PAS domain S-box protein [Nitrospira sp.]MDH5317719.1 PAS domain S-box protein [Nitrospira sp.]
MSATSHPPELDLLRKQVADLARELTERDQALRHQNRKMDGELQDLREQSEMLRAIVAGTAAETGEDFFKTLVLHLCSVFGVQYAIVGEIQPAAVRKIHTIAVSSGGSLVENFDYPLVNTPCEIALQHSFACFEREVRASFPAFERLDQLRVESYCGVSLSARDGTVIGLLAVMDTKPFPNAQRLKSLMAVFASRAGAELQRWQIENKLRDRNRHLIESQALAHLGSWDWDIDSGNVWWSDEQYRLFGHEPGTIPATHDTFLRAVYPDDRGYVQGAIDAALAGRARFDMECRIVRSNGEVRVVNCRGEVLRDSGGQPISMSGSMLDITDQTRVEEALKASQSKLRQALQASGTGLWDWNTNTNEVVFSKEWICQLGYEQGDLSCSFETWVSLLHPEDRDRAMAYVQEYVAHRRGDYRQEFRLRHKNGTYRWIEARASFATEADGRRIRLLGSHTDITDRKQMEEAVRESEERYRTLVELSPSGVFVFCEGRTVYMNHTGALLMGAKDVQEIIDRPTFDCIHPDYHQEVRENVKRLLSGGVSVHSAERIYLKLDGTPILVQVEAARITWNGKPAILGFFSDITERKEAQEAVVALNASLERQVCDRTEALRRSEERFRQFAESVGSAFLIADISPDALDVVYVNAAFTFIWGIEREEICREGSLWLDSIHPEDKERVKANHDRFVAGGTTAVFYCEYRIVGRDGYIRWIADRRVRMTGWENRIAGIAEDITSHKQQLALMQQTEAIGKIGGWELNLVTNRLWWSDETYRLHDTTPELYSPTVETALKFYAPESRPVISEALGKGVTQGLPWDLELELITAKGRRIAVRAAGMVDVVNGRAVRVYGTFQDITERKMAEEALQRAHDELERKVIERTGELRASEERYARATAIGKVGVWNLDVLNGQYHGDANLKALFGYGPEELSADPFVWLNLVYLDDQPSAMKNFELMQSGAADECHYELRMVKKDGSMIWTDVRCHGVRDRKGRLTHLIGATVDITERKEAEEALRASEELFSKAFRSSPDPMVLVELDSGRWLDVNDACLAGLGCKREDVVGRRGEELEHRLTPDDQIPFIERLKREGSIRNFEAVFQTACGERRDYLVSAEQIEYHGKSCMIILSKDITERKRVQETLRLSEERFRSLFENSPIAYQSLDLEGRFLDVNPRLCQLFGYQSEELIGRSFGDLWADDVRCDFPKTFEAFTKTGQLRNELSLRRRDGTIVNAVIDGRVQHDQDGDFIRTHCILTDITERKRMEDALRESEERFSKAFRTSPHPIGITEVATGRCIEVNDACLQAFGFRREEVIGNTTLMLGIWPNLEDRVRVIERLKAGQPVRNMEFALRAKSGDLRYFLTSADLAELNGTLCVVTVANDITDRKHAEEALRLSEERFAKAFHGSPHPLVITELDTGRVVDMNDAASQMLGYRKEEVVEETTLQIGLWDSVDERARYLDLLKRQGSTRNVEVKLRSRSGEVRQCLLSSEVIMLNGKQCSVTVGNDITERKRMEQALQLTQFSVDQAVEAILWLDSTARIFNVNDTACRMLGYSRPELTSMTVHDIDPNFPVERWTEHWGHLKEQGALAFEAKYWTCTGDVLEMEVTFNYLSYDGKEYGCAILRDIGERKRAEAELRRSHTFLRQVIDTDPDLIFAKDRDGRFTMANKAVADWYGTTVDDVIGKSDADFNANVDEVEFFRDHDLEVINSGRDRFIPEEKFTDVMGRTRWLQTVKRPIFDDTGQVHMVLGAATDITERKRMEEMLLQRERDLNAALQERERISQDLHDGILQSLYAVGLGLEGCKPMIKQQPGPVAAKFMSTLDQTIGQLNHVMGEVRNFIAGLESHVIQGGDFPSALRTMVQTMSSASRAKCVIRIDEAAARRLSTEHALHIINIVREGLSNALRHSQATQIVVSLRELVRTIRLTIRDNGIGFNTRSAQGVGHGLANMAARAQKVRGSFALQSKPWKGTKILLDLSKDGHDAHNQNTSSNHSCVAGR